MHVHFLVDIGYFLIFHEYIFKYLLKAKDESKSLFQWFREKNDELAPSNLD